MTATVDDYRACARLLRSGSRSFHAAAFLLPPASRRAASAVYAWCRLGDHAIDLSRRPMTELEELELQLDRIYGGFPVGPVERCFAEIVEGCGIPRAVPEALLEGFRWDAERRRYRTPEDLCAYCARVGSTVGVMMALVMDRRDERTLLGACTLGMAMQLTNVARDVGEDARRGRVYLPSDWLRPSGWEREAWLREPVPSAPIRGAVERTLRWADTLYGRAWPAIETLPARCRPAIRTAALVYADIGSQIRRGDCDSVSGRAFTRRSRKARLIGRALTFRSGGVLPLPRPSLVGSSEEERTAGIADAQCRFLVSAVTDG